MDVRSWKFWVIVSLGLATLACASREERLARREEVRQERLERREAARQARLERIQQSRSHRQIEEAPESSPADSAPAHEEASAGDAAADHAAPARRLSRQERLQQQRAQREARRTGRAQPQQQAAAAAPVAAAARPAPQPEPTADDPADRVVFIRGKSFAGEGNPAIYDVSDPAAPKLVGVLRRGSKLAYPVRPGQYTFMASSEAADFMQVTVVAGKTYYALVTPRMGTWNSRFAFEPLRGRDHRIDRYSRGVELAGAGDAPPAGAGDAAAQRARFWPEWDGTSQAQRAALTLRPDDGR